MGVPESGTHTHTHSAHLQDFFQSTKPGSSFLLVTAPSPWPLRWLSGKEPVCSAGVSGSGSGWGRSPGGEMTTHSSILAWEISWTEEPGGLQSVGSQMSQTQLSN